MKCETIDIRIENSENYAALSLYLLEDSKEIPIHSRPIVIVCPGGGYGGTSDREAEIIALQFTAMGYHAAVLRYSVAPAVFPTAMLELGKSVSICRSHAKEWYINPQQIVVCGFSAGGHMAASFCMFWSEPWVSERLEVSSESLRPNGMILGYPVITAGEFAHLGSIRNILGDSFEEKRDTMSLEHYVNKSVPRTFIWHTFEDQGVPVQNSLLLVNELVKQNIATEFHIFEKGGHGMALGNRLTQGNSGFGVNHACAVWIELVHNWLENWVTEGLS